MRIYVWGLNLQRQQILVSVLRIICREAMMYCFVLGNYRVGLVNIDIEVKDVYREC